MKRYTGRILTGAAVAAAVLVSGVKQGDAVLVASDTASNYGVSWAGNGGTGFDTWVFRNNSASGGAAGQFLANTGSEGDLNYIWSTDGFTYKAWGTYANNGGGGSGFQEAVAFRGFGFTGFGWANALNEAGDQFKVSLEHGGIETAGAVGFSLRNGNTDAGPGDYNANQRFEFGFQGGDSSYRYFDSTGQHSTGIGFTYDGLDVVFSMTSQNHYLLQVYSANGGSLLGTFTGQLSGTLNSTIDSVALYNRNVEYANAYFNKLEIQNAPIPEPATMALAAAGLAMLLRPRA